MGINIICVILNDLGQYWSSNSELNIDITFTSPSLGSSVSILAVIRSRTGVFFCLTLLISSFISFKVNALRLSCG